MANRTAARPAQFDRASQQRRSMIAKINIARQQLAIAEDDYRQALLDTTGKASLKDCSEPQLERMLAWLQSKGFRPLPRKGTAMHPMALKARALWISLYQLGVVHNPAEQALEAFAKRQLGCDRLVWAKQSDAYLLIEALKAMAKRAGWPQSGLGPYGIGGKPLSALALQTSLCEVILAKLKAAGGVPDDWTLADAMWRLCGIENAHEAPWTSEDYTRAAAALGAKLRELGA